MPVKFYTYAPGKGPGAIKLKPGEQLHFAQGKGYYAGPAIVTPRPSAAPRLVSENGDWGFTPRVATPPVVPPRTTAPPAYTPPPTPPAPPSGLAYPTGTDAATQAQIDAEAAREAQASLTPQQQEVQRQQQLAAQQAQADEAAIQGFQTAAAQIEQGMAPQISQGYQDAAAEIGSLGQGVGGKVTADLQQEQAANQAMAESQGQSGGSSVDAAGTGSTLSMLGGTIPGTSLASQGAAETEWAATQPLISLNAGREELDARMAQARTDNDQYAQQLIQIAAQFPDLKAQALQQLNQYELDKANYRQQVAQNKVSNQQNAAQIAEQHRVDTANIASQVRQDATQAAAEKANAAAAGVDAQYKQDESAYRWASLDFQSKKAAQAAQAAAKKGKTIDVQASKLLGHIVYKDGTQDTSIKVKQSTATTPQQKALVNRAKATSSARVTAYKYATTLLGKPTAVDSKTRQAGQAVGKKVGAYVAASSQKYGVPGGVFPPAYPGAPATTNDPSRAARTGGGASNYADAQQKVWAEIDGDGLMSRYGYSKQQVLAIVNAALARAGWRKS